MRKKLKHLRVADWPPGDWEQLQAAFEPGDIFDDDRPPGAHLSVRTQQGIIMANRRWLGFLRDRDPHALKLPAEQRITFERVKAYVTHMAETTAMMSVATQIDGLLYVARMIAPNSDWAWLRTIKQRLHGLAKASDRYDHLQSPHRTLDLGIRLMTESKLMARDPHYRRELQYRDGLIIALLSLWPIRRRSLTSLTVSGHVRRSTDQIQLLLHPEDNKSRRPEAFIVPDELQAHLEYYLDVVRPRLMRDKSHHGLWISQQKTMMTDGAIYDAVTRVTEKEFGMPMALHDFRRAAATFIATDHPDLIGLIPGVLQHVNPDVSDQHYNLARSTEASRRYTDTIGVYRDRLRFSETKREKMT
jgi:hypothetical protein